MAGALAKKEDYEVATHRRIGRAGKMKLFGREFICYDSMKFPLFKAKDIIDFSGAYSKNQRGYYCIRPLLRGVAEKEKRLYLQTNGCYTGKAWFLTMKGVCEFVLAQPGNFSEDVIKQARIQLGLEKEKKTETKASVIQDSKTEEAIEPLQELAASVPEDRPSIASVHEWNVGYRTFRIYGTLENPLFRPVDIASWIAGDDHYKMNLLDQAVENISSEHRIVHNSMINQQKSTTIFLTFDGLMELLESLDIPEAKFVRGEIQQELTRLSNQKKAAQRIREILKRRRDKGQEAQKTEDYREEVIQEIETVDFLGETLHIYGDWKKPFVRASRVAEWIGYDLSNIKQMVKPVSNGDKKFATILPGEPGKEEWFLTENGIYEVMERSDKPGARKYRNKVAKIFRSFRAKYPETTLSIVASSEKSVAEIGAWEFLGKELRIYGSVEAPLFLANDVAEWIGYNQSKVGQMLGSVDENEKLTDIIYRSGQNRRMWLLTEDGLYEVLMQSRKPVAKQYKQKVKEILREIRKTGHYGESATSQQLQDITKALGEVVTRGITSFGEIFTRAMVERDKMFLDTVSTMLRENREYLASLPSRVNSAQISQDKDTKEESELSIETVRHNDEVTLYDIAKEMHWISLSGKPNIAFARTVAAACGINIDSRKLHEDEYSRCSFYIQDDITKSVLYIKDKGVELISKWCEKYDNGRSCICHTKYRRSTGVHKVGDIKDVYYVVKPLDPNKNFVYRNKFRLLDF